MHLAVRVGAAAMAASVLAVPANAACPMALATYAEQERVAEINFTPALGGATVTNTFRMILPGDFVLDGMVQWSGEPVPYARPYGAITYRCPEGDATGDELAACTIWQGVIYAQTKANSIELLPLANGEAPPRLLFPGLAPALLAHPALELAQAPWDVFELSGCQE